MFKVLFAKQKKLPWKPKKDRGAKPCLSRFPRELRVRCFARDARPTRPSARLLFPIATPHQGRDGCWAIYLYEFHYMPLRRLKQYHFSRRRRSEPISAHLWAEINSKKFARAPWKVGGGRGRTPRIAGSVPVCSKKVGTRFSRVYLRLCAIRWILFQLRFSNWNSIFPCLPAVLLICSNCSGFKQVLYIHTYIDPFLYSFLSRFRLKIIGTNGTFTRNAW